MSEWREHKLGSVVKIKKDIISGPFGSNISRKFFVESGIPVIRGNNLSLSVGNKFSDDDFVFLTEEKAKDLGTWAEINDLVFTAAGTIGQVGLITGNLNYSRYIISNKQLRVRLDNSIADPYYGYYWFSNPSMREMIISCDTGSTIPLINLTVLRSLPIILPPLKEQKAIAEVLSVNGGVKMGSMKAA